MSETTNLNDLLATIEYALRWYAEHGIDGEAGEIVLYANPPSDDVTRFFAERSPRRELRLTVRWLREGEQPPSQETLANGIVWTAGEAK